MRPFRFAILALIAGAALLCACAYRPTPVILQASAGDILTLAGAWEGTYQGRESERLGSITFTIDANSDTAHGDVLMETPMQQQIIAADASTNAHRMHARAPEVLRITWVGLHRGYVEGAIEPYIAPDCRCTVKTVFNGYVSDNGDVITGEFITTGPSVRQTGTWSVRRRKP